MGLKTMFRPSRDMLQNLCSSDASARQITGPLSDELKKIRGDGRGEWIGREVEKGATWLTP